MKKFLIFSICAILAVILTGCNGNKLTTYQQISYQELKEKLEAKETFPILIGKQTCSACALFKPTIEKFIKEYQVKVYYLDIESLSEEEETDFQNWISITGTPTVAFVKEGKEDGKSGYNRINGSKDYEDVVNKFEKNGYKK